NMGIAEFDYAYAPLGTLGDSHRFSLIGRLEVETAGRLLAPTSLAAQGLDGSIALSWKPVASRDVVGYNLYLKRPGTETFTLITGHPLADTTVKFEHLRNGVNYTFALAAVSAAGRESPSVQVSAMPVAGAIAPGSPQAPE